MGEVADVALYVSRAYHGVADATAGTNTTPRRLRPSQPRLHGAQARLRSVKSGRKNSGSQQKAALLRTMTGMTASAGPRQTPPSFASFREFYPFYLEQHSNRASRRLHVVGTLLAMAIAAAALADGRWALLLAVPVAGYLPAWVGHFFFEGNSPATFSHPLYSLRGDLSMLAEVLTGRMRW